MAERAGISRTNISRFESGEYNPTLEMLVKLATAMDLDILVTLKPKNNNDTECDNDVTSSPPTCDNYITSSIQKYAVLSHFCGKKAAYFL